MRVSAHHPGMEPSPKPASEYLPEEQARFRQNFRPRLADFRHHQLVEKRIMLFVGFPLFGVICLAPKGNSGPILMWIWFVFIAALVLYSTFFRPKLACPACLQNLEDRKDGNYCPACSSTPLERKGWLHLPKCNVCGEKMRTGKGGRRYKIRHCTHCGLFLDEAGF